MGFHTYDADRADALEDAAFRYRYLSAEEFVHGLEPSPDAVAADLGSGTGFYTDEAAPYLGCVYAVDIQDEMHAYYRDKGVPDNVETVTAAIADLPFEDGALDIAFSTMTYHEFASPEAADELRLVLADGGHLFVADWSAEGTGEAGPPTDERYDAAHAADEFDTAGFDVERVEERAETFILRATA